MALRRERRHRKAIVNTYCFHDELIASPGIKTKDFPAYDREWLHFAAGNRDGIPVEDYDLVQGGIADLHCRSDQYIVDELKTEYQNR